MQDTIDPPQLQASGSESSESPAQKQARLRRERRDAKIKAGGSSRLDKITQLSGRPMEPPLSNQPIPPAESNASALDPEEIDITNHPYTSRSPVDNKNSVPVNGPTEADIRALLRSGAPAPGVDTGPGESQQPEEDPMMRLFQQMMGGMGGEPGSEGDGGLPPGLATMLGGGGGEGGGGGMSGQGAATSSAYIWRITHALYALVLGVYLVSHASFTSSARLTAGRSTAAPPASAAEPEQPLFVNMFWIFATAELVLQGSRFFLEPGRSRSQGGWLQLIGGVLPEPWRGWARLVGQYGGIWKTLVEDAMIVVFVLGIVGWWRGMEG